LVHDIQREPIDNDFIHADFYQVNLEEKIEANIPLVFEGEAPAIKELGGTLVKAIHEIEVKAKPADLPKEIIIDISVLKTFEDSLAVKDIVVPAGVEVIRKPEDTIVYVAEPEKVEEELAKPVEEKVEDVEKVEKEKKEEEAPEEETK
jgi:large subunit ribosomal protein L25